METEQIENESPQADFEKLDSLGLSLAKSRSESISARRSSGIEDRWTKAEEQYEGIDDANRSQGASIDSRGAFSSSSSGTKATRSTAYVNITRPYTDAASARVADMLLPTDERNFGVDCTPVPTSLIDMAKGKFTKGQQGQIEAATAGNPGLMAQTINQAKEEADNLIKEMRAKAKRAEDRIEDWFIEGQYYSVVREVIEDSAKYGVGILKGPYPVKRKTSAIFEKDGQIQIVMEEKIVPESKRVNPWNFFPDPACGGDIRKGGHIWERDTITRKGLRDLKGVDGYIDEQIDAVLAEGPQAAEAEVRTEFSENTGTDKPYEIWYYQGCLEAEDMRAAGCECDDGDYIDAFITLVNNRVIRAVTNPLDTGEFIYDTMPWQRRSGSWDGIGIPEQGETPQRIVNAGVRNMMDNAGIAAGGIFLYRDGSIEPVDGKWELGPRKFFRIGEDAEVVNTEQIFKYIEIPIRQQELGQIIQFALKVMEDVTGLPMIMQGQQGKAPETVGGMQLLNANASTVLRRIARIFDDRVTEPHVRRYYAWLLQYGEDEKEKGDFQIFARGSTALVERDQQTQFLMQSVPLVLQAPPNVTGIDTKKFLKAVYKNQKMDTEEFFLTPEELTKIEQTMQKSQQQKPDQGTQIAQVKAQTQVALQDKEQKFEAQENQKDRETELAIARLEHQFNTMKLNGDRQSNIEELKAKLAEITMELRSSQAETAAKLKTQRDLGSVRPVTKPPTEPPGRAPAGMAYQR